MKVLIVKTTSGFVDLKKANTYNIQETGLAKAINRLGHQCDVVFPGKGKSWEEKLPFNEKGDTFTVFFLKQWDFLRNNIYSDLNKMVEQYDIIHSGGYDTIQSWLLARRFPQKVIIYNGTYHSDFNKKYNIKCKIIDLLFVPTYKRKHITFDTKNRLSELFLREKGLKDVTSVGVGIDLSRIEYESRIDDEFVQKVLRLKESGKRLLLYIGRIEPRRNLFFLLDVVREVSRTEDVKLVMIGSKGPDLYKKKVFEYIKTAGLENIIVYKASLDQKFLKAIYRSCDVFLLPTLYEIFGMVLLEAMYYGLPVISTLNGGSDLMIKNGKNGFIEENNNIHAWVSRLKYIFSHSKEMQHIGDYAHNTIGNEFTWDALAVKFVRIFENKLMSNDK